MTYSAFHRVPSRTFLLLAFISSFSSFQPAFALGTTDSALSSNLRNFQKVSDGIWRGAEPSRRGLETLANSGAKTIIDLRINEQDAMQESQEAKRLGMRYVHVPMGFTKPSIDRLRGIMRIAINPANQPVFIHCAQGADRTGTLCALYRRVFQGWSFPKTYSEMRAHHFKPFLFALKNTVRDFKADDFSQQALDSAPDFANLTDSHMFDSATEVKLDGKEAG